MASNSSGKTGNGGGKTSTTSTIISGTTGDDQLYLIDAKYRGYYGSTSRATIDGGNGRDLIFGRKDDENISGGGGSDWVNGGGGNDTLDGGGGTSVDWLSFQRYTYGGFTYNAYAGGVTADLGTGTFSYDAFGVENPYAGQALQFENLYGSEGDDRLTGDAKGNEIRGGTGNDLIVGGAGADKLYGDEGDDTLVGGIWKPGDALPTAREMRNANDNNVLEGGAGNDLLVSAIGNDWIDGGDGYDVVDYSYLPEGFQVRLTLIPDGVWAKATVYTIGKDGREVVYENDWVRNVEGIRGGLANDALVGDPTRANRIDGGGGDDSITGGNLDDVLEGGTGNDTLSGGGGNDTLDGGRDDDVVDGGDGDDLLIGSGGGNDTFIGGDGIDTLSFGKVPGKDYDPCTRLLYDDRSLVIDLGRAEYSWKQDSLTAFALWYGSVTGVENVIGSRCGDQIAGDDGDNELDGGSGNDLLYGAGGNDVLRGGAGRDWGMFTAVTSGNTPEARYLAGGSELPATASTLSATAMTAAEASADPYASGISANLSTHGGWYAYRSETGNWASKTDGLRQELSGVEDLLGSAGDDRLTGDAGAYLVFEGVLASGRPSLGAGDELSFKLDGGMTRTVTLGSVSSGVLTAVQQAIDTKVGAGVLIADSVHGTDLRLRVVDSTQTNNGTTTARTLAAGVLVDASSTVTAREILDDADTYLAFDRQVPQLSVGDRISFKVDGTEHTITLGAFTPFGAEGYSEASLQTVVDAALSTAGLTGTVSADIVNGVDLWFKATVSSPLSSGTLQNAVFSVDTVAALDNVLVGDGGFDQIWGGLGDDTVYGGAADFDGTFAAPGNRVYGGDGSDTFHVGYDYDPVKQSLDGQGRTELSAASTDVILDWDGVGQAVSDTDSAEGTGSYGRDSLYVGTHATALIGGLAGQPTLAGEPAEPDWSGNDLVDLRGGDGSVVNNLGRIVVVSGDGDDTIYGSNGVDWVFGGKGLNTIDLGASTVDGADRVFIDTFLGKYNVKGFDSQDKLYIHRGVIDAFVPTNDGRSAWMLDRGLTSISDPTAAATITTGHAYSGFWAGLGNFDSNQFWSPLSPVIYQPTYDAFLNVFPQYEWQDQPIALTVPVLGELFNKPLWQSNGAWTNASHEYAELIGDFAIGAAGGYQILVGLNLLAIPIVGPILGIPLIVNGSFMIRDATIPAGHLNTTYANADASGLTSLVSFMDSQNPGSSNSTVGTWDARNFLDFYNIPQDKYTPTLEVTSHPVKEGIYTIATVYNGTNGTDGETFVYLVYSPDRMIQNNETRLIAQINGRVTADQVVLYDDDFAEITQFAQGGLDTPVFAPKVGSVVLVADDDEIEPVPEKEDAGEDSLPRGLLTSDASPTVVFTLEKDLVEGDDVEVRLNGVAVLAPAIDLDGDTITVQVPQQFDGQYVIDVRITNAQGFTSDHSTSIRIDATPIPEADITVLSTEEGIQVGFRQDDPSSPNVDESATPEDATVTLTTVSPTAALGSEGGYAALLEVGAAGSVTTGALTITDALGRVTPLTGYNVALGTAGNDDTVTGSITGESGKINFLYGFGGDDSLTGAGLADALYGGAGNDILLGLAGHDELYGGAGNDSLDGGDGDDVLVGGAGADTLTGGAGKDSFVWNALSEFGQDDQVADFESGEDTLQFSASMFGNQFQTLVDIVVPGIETSPGKQAVVTQLEANQFESGANLTVATGASTRFFYNESTGDLYYDADGSGGASATLVAQLTGMPTLLFTDFLIV